MSKDSAGAGGTIRDLLVQMETRMKCGKSFVQPSSSQLSTHDDNKHRARIPGSIWLFCGPCGLQMLWGWTELRILKFQFLKLDMVTCTETDLQRL